jgi:hypothetical protein
MRTIGSARLWLLSLRSMDSQRGGLSMVFGRPLPVWQMQWLEATILLGGVCKHWHLGRKRLVMTIIKEGEFVVDWYGQRRKFVVLNDDFTPVLTSQIPPCASSPHFPCVFLHWPKSASGTAMQQISLSCSCQLTPRNLGTVGRCTVVIYI